MNEWAEKCLQHKSERLNGAKYIQQDLSDVMLKKDALVRGGVIVEGTVLNKPRVPVQEVAGPPLM